MNDRGQTSCARFSKDAAIVDLRLDAI